MSVRAGVQGQFQYIGPTMYAFFFEQDVAAAPPSGPTYGPGTVRYGQSVSTNMPVQDSQTAGVGSSGVRGRERRPV